MADKSGREMQTAPVEHAARKENKDMSIAELEAAFGCTADGLSSTQVADLRRLHGYNEIPEEQRSAILKFLSYFWGPIPWMIEAAAVISALVQHWSDLIIVSVLLVVNAVVGFWEEFEAGNAIAALKSRLALSARTLRNGIWSNIPARELAPGDRIRLRLGDIVPADAKILSGDPIDVDQSALTGESLPVSRSIGESVFSGSIIRQGEVDALVYATGQGTFFGKTASLVETTRTTSHFQRAVLKIGNFLILLAIILVAIIVLVALFRGDPFTTTLQFALILTVAAIPVAMPTVLTVTMAVGARILARSKAIVSKLASIEELAGMDTLCSDKTGTLTQNTLTLGDPFTISAVTKEEIITSAALASRAENNDSIDLAILARVNDVARLSTFTTTHFQPFDPVHKRTEATVQDSSGRTFKVSKGAPQVILSISKNGPLVREQTEHAIANFANRGFRALGVARTNDDGDWQFLGVLPLFDPPRVDSKETIHEAVRMGCNIKMITGDQTAIAKETAKQLGLGTDILDASIFSSVNYHQEAHVSDQIEACDGVAQVFPEHKYHIVDTLQKRGHIVGMTGDGVNDAPALKKADVGIAVSGATDAARAAAAIVLLEPGLLAVIDAVKESRKIFQRMTTYAVYRITETVRVLLFMTLSILVFNFYPVTAVMIVLLALLNDGAILSIAYDNVRYADKPEKWNMRPVLGVASVLGIAGVISSFGLFYVAERVFKVNRDFIQSLMYLKLSVAGHLTVFVTRTRGPFYSIRPAPILFWAVIGTQILATLIAVYGIFMPAIGWQPALLVWAYALTWFLVNDRIKIFAYSLFNHGDHH